MLGAVHHRHDQPPLGGHGDADVRVGEDEQLLLRELDVDGAMPHEGGRAHLHQHVRDGDAFLGVEARRRSTKWLTASMSADRTSW